jgi:hypothetical protein
MLCRSGPGNVDQKRIYLSSADIGVREGGSGSEPSYLVQSRIRVRTWIFCAEQDWETNRIFCAEQNQEMNLDILCRAESGSEPACFVQSRIRKLI